MKESINAKVRRWGLHYALICGALILGFSQFVACGSQMYQVALEDDVKPESVPAYAREPGSPSYGIHAPNGWLQLPIRFKTGVKLSPPQHMGLVRAMNSWEMAVGRQLFEYEGVHSGTNGDTFNDLYSSLGDRVNGHYLDNNWGKTKKPAMVLATTIWDNYVSDHTAIQTADIRFNSDYYKLGDALTLTADGQREVVDMETLALHELGHLLGLAHVSEEHDAFSIMTPSLYIGEGLENRRLSKGDIQRLQKVYGCGGRSCDVVDVQNSVDAKSRTDYSLVDLEKEAELSH